MGKALDQLVQTATELFWKADPHHMGPKYWEPYCTFTASDNALNQAPDFLKREALWEIYQEDIHSSVLIDDNLNSMSTREILNAVLEWCLTSLVNSQEGVQVEAEKRFELCENDVLITEPSPALNPR